MMRDQPKRRFEPFTDFLLEQYLCGDTSPEDTQRIESMAARTPALAEYLRERRAERDAFALQHPRLDLQLRKKPQRPTLWAGAVATVLTCTAVAVFLIRPAENTPE